jgi:hypothetical protein
MVRVYAVIGRANSRKTSTIRALTGAGTTQKRWSVLYLTHGPARTYVHPRALQEGDVFESPHEFIERVSEVPVEHVIVALRERAGERPSAVAYLEAFRGAGWNIAGYAVLGSDTLLPGFDRGIIIHQSRNTPSNEIAARLREEWRIR